MKDTKNAAERLIELLEKKIEAGMTHEEKTKAIELVTDNIKTCEEVIKKITDTIIRLKNIVDEKLKDKNDFGWAINQMRNGEKVKRRAWGKESLRYVFCNDAKNMAYFVSGDGGVTNLNHFNNSDLFATDWELYEEDWKINTK